MSVVSDCKCESRIGVLIVRVAVKDLFIVRVKEVKGDNSDQILMRSEMCCCK